MRIIFAVMAILISVIAYCLINGMEASAETLTVTNSYANCRSNPGAKNAYLGRVYAGQTYDVISEGKAPNGKLWYKTNKGWICSSFVRINRSTSPAAPAHSTNGEIIETPSSQSKDGPSTSPYFSLSVADKRYIASVVSAEARGESYKGQMAVAQVIHDRAKRNEQNPITVVKAPNQFAKPWCGGKYTDSCYKAVCAVFDSGERVTKEETLYFVTLKCNPSWLKGKKRVAIIGNHKFYR